MSAIGIAVVLFIAGTWFARPLHRMCLHFAVADAYRGLDTLLAPVVSLFAMVAVSLLTQTTHRPRHDELKRVPSERDLVAGLGGA